MEPVEAIRCRSCGKIIAIRTKGKVSTSLTDKNSHKERIGSNVIAEIEIQCYNRMCKAKNLIRLEQPKEQP